MTSEAQEQGTNPEDDAIDTLFEGETEEEISTETETKDAKAETEETSTEETGETTESESAAEKEPTLVPIAALLDERRKRQEAEDLAEERMKLIPKEEETAPDMYEDPEGYKAYVKAGILKEQEDDRVADHTKKVEDSRSAMLSKHEDYTDVEKAFMVLTMYDDTLASKMNASDDPALFAYGKGKEYLESLKPAAETTVESTEETGKSEVKAPNLATATAVDTNSTAVEKDEGDDDLDTMCDDMGY